MNVIEQSFAVQFSYKVLFTRHAFAAGNRLILDLLAAHNPAQIQQKLLFVVDQCVLDHHPSLGADIAQYFAGAERLQLIPELVTVAGGESIKNDPEPFDRILDAINHHGIDRHSYVIGIGGGALLDLVGYVAAIAHRGVRHIRMPTTVLSQNDSGVGVKNGINFRGKKNFLGTFAPPFAVINDAVFLDTLPQREWLAGISEAVKVSLIKDRNFFEWIEANATALRNRDADAMQYLIYHCAELHVRHIGGYGDPFEKGSSRPLDFGHWSAHKLEQLSGFSVLHGEAVAMGICLDCVYSRLDGRLSADDCERVIQLFTNLGLKITHPLLKADGDESPLVIGLQEFREHLGGRLTIMLLNGLGIAEEVHEMNTDLIRAAAEELQGRATR